MRKASSEYQWCAGSIEKEGPGSLRKLPNPFLWLFGELKQRDAGSIKRSWPVMGGERPGMYQEPG